MVRKQVYITEEQDAKLKRLAEARGETEAEVVRGALDGLKEVTYDQSEAVSRGVREVATREYIMDESTNAQTNLGREGRSSRTSLAEQAWQEELAFIRKLAASRPNGGTLERFDRDELYEERLSKLLH